MTSSPMSPRDMSSQPQAVIIGTGSCIPARTVLNEDFLGRTFFEDYGQPFAPEAVPRMVAKLKEITDIAERRYVADGRVASDLAVDAARRALASAAIPAWRAMRVDPAEALRWQ